MQEACNNMEGACSVALQQVLAACNVDIDEGKSHVTPTTILWGV